MANSISSQKPALKAVRSVTLDSLLGMVEDLNRKARRIRNMASDCSNALTSEPTGDAEGQKEPNGSGGCYDYIPRIHAEVSRLETALNGIMNEVVSIQEKIGATDPSDGEAGSSSPY